MLTALKRAADSEVVYRFWRSPLAVVAFGVVLVYVVAAAAALLIAPFDPFTPASLDLMDAFTPPAWTAGGDPRFLLGTDDQGRDIFSAILYGSRISLLVGLAAVLLSMVIGVTLGVLSGYWGGWFDAIAMRLADIQLTIPGILIALLIDGLARSLLPLAVREDIALWVLIVAIGISEWPQYARVVRSATLVERRREYVAAAHLMGLPSARIVGRHVLPNVLGPVLVIATIGMALAIITEATLSFLGVGMPPTTPSLGTLIRVGNNFLFSGEWWMVFFPAGALVLLVLAINLLGDWLRDTLNPKLR